MSKYKCTILHTNKLSNILWYSIIYTWQVCCSKYFKYASGWSSSDKSATTTNSVSATNSHFYRISNTHDTVWWQMPYYSSETAHLFFCSCVWYCYLWISNLQINMFSNFTNKTALIKRFSSGCRITVYMIDNQRSSFIIACYFSNHCSINAAIPSCILRCYIFLFLFCARYLIIDISLKF